MDKRFPIIDKVITEYCELENNEQDESGDEDINDYSGMIIIFLPCITKLTALNLTIFFFVDIDLKSSQGNRPPANSNDTIMLLHLLADCHPSSVSSSKKEEEYVDNENKRVTTLDLDDKDFL